MRLKWYFTRFELWLWIANVVVRRPSPDDNTSRGANLYGRYIFLSLPCGPATNMWLWNESSLLPVIVCRLFSNKPLLICIIINWTHRKTYQWNFNQNLEIFFGEKSFEYAMSMWCVKWRPVCSGFNQISITFLVFVWFHLDKLYYLKGY